MKFPIKFCGVEIKKTYLGYLACIAGECKYINKSGTLEGYYKDCFHETLQSAAKASLLFRIGEEAARVVDATDGDEQLYRAIKGESAAAVCSIRVLTRAPESAEERIREGLAGMEFCIDYVEDIKLSDNYGWDGSFFEKEKC